MIQLYLNIVDLFVVRLSNSELSIENPRYGGSSARESRGLSIEEGFGGATTGATAANILDLSVDVSRGSLGLLPDDIIAGLLQFTLLQMNSSPFSFCLSFCYLTNFIR